MNQSICPPPLLPEHLGPDALRLSWAAGDRRGLRHVLGMTRDTAHLRGVIVALLVSGPELPAQPPQRLCAGCLRCQLGQQFQRSGAGVAVLPSRWLIASCRAAALTAAYCSSARIRLHCWHLRSREPGRSASGNG